MGRAVASRLKGAKEAWLWQFRVNDGEYAVTGLLALSRMSGVRA